jgi:hypothetical protein
VHDARAGRHNLNVVGPNDTDVACAITMRKSTLQWHRDNLHIFMPMRSKPTSSLQHIETIAE